MKRLSSGPILTTVFVDYDNIYLSLKKKNDEAAKRFAKDSGLWLQGILTGELITPTSGLTAAGERRLVMNRCYGNPVPRRNSNDNSTDMNSFPFIRHHFLKSGFEVIDCPPLTAQLKNSADIRIVMDIRDIITHDTFFDEFVIMSGDADFTPVLHRLRAHARRTVVFANDHTAQPYTALSDGEIRESTLIQLLLRDLNTPQLTSSETQSSSRELSAPVRVAPVIDVDAARRAILAEVVNFVRTAPQAVPLETLADRAVRLVGHDRTVGTQWGGFGSFRDLLLAGLPDDIHLSDTAPYTVFDANRHISATGLIAPQLALPAGEALHVEAPVQRTFQPAPDFRGEAQRPEPQREPLRQDTQRPDSQRPDTQRMMPGFANAPIPQPAPAHQPAQSAAHGNPQQPAPQAHVQQSAPQAPGQQRRPSDALPPLASRPVDPAFSARLSPQQGGYSNAPQNAQPASASMNQTPAPAAGDQRREAPRTNAPMAPQQQAPLQNPAPPVQRTADQATQIQQSIARIHDACQAPALAPAEYRVLFEVMAQELTSNGLQGAQTLSNITQRAREFGLDLKRDDLRFILEVVSESDPWFEQGASANLFAGRFRNFVVARCRSQGLNLSADELDLVDAWFSSQGQQASRAQTYARTAPPQPQAAPVQQQAAAAPAAQQQPAAQTGTGGRDYTPQSDRWWSLEEGRQHIAEQRSQGSYGAAEPEDEFPRIVRSRLRG
ncbi:MAG: NYN domain-containing protein [Hyphomicrobium sp.]